MDNSNQSLIIVTGAPGSGKSTAIEGILELKSPFLVFDIDWLAASAGELAKKNIFVDPESWAPYNALWREVLHSVYRNAQQAIFFTPNSPDDLPTAPDWCGEVRWLLLDCDDDVREQRLANRLDWTLARKTEAFRDAAELRTFDLDSIDTGRHSVSAVASKVLSFARRL